MTIIVVGMYRGAIIVAEASTESAQILNQAFRQGIEGGVEAITTGQDAQALWQTIENSFSGNGLETTKVIGSTAFGAAVTVVLVETGVASAAIGAAAFAAGVVLSPALLGTAAIVAGAAAGYYAGEYYAWVFDELVRRGDVIGDGIHELFGNFIPGISDSTPDSFTTATLLPAPRRDPLVLDLDGDGIKSAVLNNPSAGCHDQRS